METESNNEAQLPSFRYKGKENKEKLDALMSQMPNDHDTHV